MTLLELFTIMHEVVADSKATDLAGLPPIAEMQQAMVDDPELGKLLKLFASKIKRA